MRIATLGLGVVTDLNLSADLVRSARYGEYSVLADQSFELYFRWWPRLASRWDVMRDAYLRSLPTSECRVYYSFPIRCPDYMTINYVHSGKGTQYKTVRQAIVIANEIAQLKKAAAIVCQITNERITQRMMNRWGFVQHAQTLGNNHFIKRLNRSGT